MNVSSLLVKPNVLSCTVTPKFLSSSVFNRQEKKDKFGSKDFKEFRKTPIGKLDELAGKHPHAEKDPLPEWKDGVNPDTGEIGGPKGVEPTRYGDWERKGRVTDF